MCNYVLETLERSFLMISFTGNKEIKVIETPVATK